MILAWLLLLTGLTISAVAIYYSVVGLAAIFAAAAIPIYIMGSALEVAKLVCASWLKANWERVPRLMKTYMTIAVVVLMFITSMGIFGFLSKAHLDQSIVSGDVVDKVAILDEKIKTQKDNIEAARKALRQMDEAVDQTMARSTDEKGADKAAALRRNQARERTNLQNDIAKAQKAIAALNEERAPIAKDLRKVEAEVGPIKYIAKLIYGDNPDANLLEKAVTWVIIVIVFVFDPLAVIMLLAAQMTFQWAREQKTEEMASDLYEIDNFKEPEPEDTGHVHSPWPFPVKEKEDDFKFLADEKDLYPEGKPWEEEKKEVPATELVTDQGGEQTAQEEQQKPAEEVNLEPDYLKRAEDRIQEKVAQLEETPMPVEQWNKMIEEAEKAVEEESKKKTYMTKDETGKIQVKNRS
jgi:hypothetical protein